MDSFLNNPAFTTIISAVLSAKPEIALGIEIFKIILNKVHTMSAERKRAIMQMDSRLQFLFQELAKDNITKSYKKELEIRLHETLYHAILIAEETK
jgi:hypothetical protein